MEVTCFYKLRNLNNCTEIGWLTEINASKRDFANLNTLALPEEPVLLNKYRLFLVSAVTVFFFKVSGTMLCFGFRRRKMLMTYQCF